MAKRKDWLRSVYCKKMKCNFTSSSLTQIPDFRRGRVGVNSGMTISRIGVDTSWVQDFFQNGIHKNISGSPYFDTRNGPPTNWYLRYGIYSTFSLY